MARAAPQLPDAVNVVSYELGVACVAAGHWPLRTPYIMPCVLCHLCVLGARVLAVAGLLPHRAGQALESGDFKLRSCELPFSFLDLFCCTVSFAKSV